MTKGKEFDLLNSPLEGTNLIEASAGTGKTYTITGLFVRLLLEKELSIDQILVVTFTEAAAGELKERIRSKLREALEAFAQGRSEDPFLNELVARHSGTIVPLRCLREALRAFDQAAVFTIHGFCLRILHENAFESGALFDTELITEQENIKREIVEDFWRRYFYHASPLFVHYSIKNNVSPRSLLGLLGTILTQPYLKIIPQVVIPDTSGLEKEYHGYFENVREAWQKARTEVAAILTNYEGLNRNKYRKDHIPIWIHSMDRLFTSGGISPSLFKGFEKFTSSELERSLRRDYDPPIHSFFTLCENLKKKQQQLEEVFDRRLMGIKSELFHFTHNELAKRKEERNVQSFDDLLAKVQRALSVAGGEALAKAIRLKFKTALIDEFQDTDPIQYAIFRKIFGKGNSTLFLIGDPKQAIYGFRGADIFAYLGAACHVEQRYTLKENWRSEPDLITAINTIFGNTDHPFVYEDIVFHSARPAERQDLEKLSVEGEAGQPLQLWFLDSHKVAASGNTITKGQARELIPRAVAAEISRLLNLSRKNKACLGTRPLRASDFAVLVRRNTEARLVQQALSELHIPSVLYSTESLFESHEAVEVERVLAAIAEPGNERLLRAGLATDMMGISGEELGFLLEDNTGWEKWIVRYRDYHRLWNERGFIVMFRRLLSELTVLSRLISLPNGERRSTNVLHLSEVLHRASIDSKLGMSGLLKWLSEKRAGDAQWKEEHQLRLENDETAVKLVTIHKSKGLEYPIVFCPFAWDGSRLRNSTDPFIFHNEDDNMRLTLDLGSAEKQRHRALAEKELLAERLRLLYVALSRSRNRCYLVWGRFNEGETSAPAYLFHLPKSRTRERIVDATAGRFEELSDKDILAELTNVQDKAKGVIGLSAMPLEAGETYHPSPEVRMDVRCRRFSGKIDRQWQVSSFSALVSGKPLRTEEGDRDALSVADPYDRKSSQAVETGEEPSSMFSFPKGTKAGTFLHNLLEHLDFAQMDPAAMQRLVTDKLQEYGFDLAWQDALCEMIQKLLCVQLELERKDFRLAGIQNRDRLNELEFYFPLKPTSAKQLQNLFAQYGGPEIGSEFPQQIERLNFAPIRGFMKGFIDMVFQFQSRFYLVDWKSNFLGSRVEDYDQEKLAAAMHKEFYILQYHIYSLALHQYLQARLPGYEYKEHFGGVYYIFLRGVDPDRAPEYGIYRDKPSDKLIATLGENLIDQTKVGRS